MSGVAPSGWYQDPNDPARQRFWNGKTWSGAVRPLREPDIEGRWPAGVTFAALFLVTVAWAMQIPILLKTVSAFSAPPGQELALLSDLWFLAFLVGVTSFVLALVSRSKERGHRSRSGRRCAAAALALAIVGACVSSIPVLLQAGTGL